MNDELPFAPTFLALTGNEPFPWQRELYSRLLEGDWSRLSACDIPTGLGKTAIIPIWLIALANRAPFVPRRLVYVVNRRTVVDQATSEAERLREKLQSPQGDNPTPDVVASRRHLSEALSSLSALPSSIPLAISTLRGQFADNREWS
ncbi:MAG TPA: hypothetical protein VFT74_10305, partial [Isosphaeraceae bacterium]|nr:hypothetical protein [Isosphaeraceae bacterium]